MSVVSATGTAPSPVLRFARRSPAAATGGAILVFVLLVAALAPLIAPYDPNLQAIDIRLAPPSAAHLLGTDGFGRDILSRLIFGTRPTLLLISLVALIMAPLGTAIGIVAGTYGGMSSGC